MGNKPTDSKELMRPLFPQNGQKADFSGFMLFDEIVDYAEVPHPDPEKNEKGASIEVIAAIEGYSRLVNAIVLQWGHPECTKYINDLILNETDRTKRQGFSSEVMQELYMLQEVNDIVLKKAEEEKFKQQKKDKRASDDAKNTPKPIPGTIWSDLLIK